MSEQIFKLAGKRVWVAGHRGMVGAALMRRLAREDCEILTADRQRVDLRRQDETEAWVTAAKPDVIFLAAAKVGGILANRDNPGTFLYDNLMIAVNVMEAARCAGVNKLLFLGSSCIYPRLAPQPIREEALLSGPLEPTNESYAVAKIAGIKLAQAYRRQYGCHFISAQPTNLYGPGDNFDLETSHVVAALMRKAHEAKISGAEQLTVWGSGKPSREFLHVDDLADALVFLIHHYDRAGSINIGTGEELTIGDLAVLVAEIVGFSGDLVFDTSKPDGTPRKVVDASRLHDLGWRHAIALRDGLAEIYRWFLDHAGDARGLTLKPVS